MAKKKETQNQTRLRGLIEEATADCYELSEQFEGLFNMIEENLRFPFQAKVIGQSIEVTDVATSPFAFGIQAICKQNGEDYRIDLTSLEWFGEPPGFEWIEAYLEWLKTAVE
jgi:hypothetical protein